jgi:hypothetical protein
MSLASLSASLSPSLSLSLSLSLSVYQTTMRGADFLCHILSTMTLIAMEPANLDLKPLKL